MKLLTSSLVVTIILFQMPTSAVAQNSPQIQTAQPNVTPIGDVMLHKDTLIGGPCTFYIPKVFATNADQVRDGWRISSLCDHTIVSFNLEVFNRWGELSFETNDISEYWNGKADGDFVQPGLYNYKISVEVQSDGQLTPAERTGHIRVIPPSN